MLTNTKSSCVTEASQTTCLFCCPKTMYTAPGPAPFSTGEKRQKSEDVGHRLRGAAVNRPPPPRGAEHRGSPPARAARPPGATRRRQGRGHHILYAGKLPPKTPEPMLDTSRQKHCRDGPSVADVCVSPAGWRFVRRLKLGVVPAYHRAGRMMKSRRRRAEGDSRGGELRGRRVVSF